MIRMIEEIKISKAEYEELDAVLHLQKKAFLSEAELYNNYEIEPLLQTIDSIKADYKDHLFLKAVFRGNIVGSIKARDQNGYCWVGKLMVHPDFRGRGVGRKLMNEIETFFPSVTSFFLFTGSKSVKNIGLYESLGYRKKDEFYDDRNPGVVLIKMVKEKTFSS